MVQKHYDCCSKRELFGSEVQTVIEKYRCYLLVILALFSILCIVLPPCFSSLSSMYLSLTFVPWPAVPPSSVASKFKPFSMGNRPTLLRVNQSVNLGTWVNRSQGWRHPLMHSSALWEHRQLFLGWTLPDLIICNVGRMGNCINSSVTLYSGLTLLERSLMHACIKSRSSVVCFLHTVCTQEIAMTRQGENILSRTVKHGDTGCMWWS